MPAALRRALATLVVASAVVGLAVACDRGPTESPPPPPERVEESRDASLRIGLAEAPASLDPYRRPIDTSTLQVLRGIFDTLLVVDDNSQLRPGLAAEVRPNDDFTEFTVSVRPDVTFSDGTPVDAAAVAAGLDAARRSPSLLDLLAPITAVTVDGSGADATVRISMDEPWASFPYQLAGPVGMVVAPAMLASEDPGRQPIGAGPYVLTSWTDGGLVLDQRQGYWREGQPVIARIELPVVTDPSVRVTRLQQGTLDIATVLEPEQMARVRADSSGLQVLSDPSDETAEWVMVLNTTAAPFDDKMAREAVAFSIDRDAIVTRVFAGQYRASKGPYSEGSRFYGDARWPILDIGHADDLAKQVAAAQGAPLGFTLTVGPDGTSTELGRLLQSQFAEVGIDADLSIASSGEQLDDALANRTFDAALVPLFDGAHPDDDADLLGFGTATGARANPSGYTSEALAEALVDARASDDITTQAEAYAVVQKELATQLPYLFLVHGQGLLVAGPHVQDLHQWSTPDGYPGITQVRMTVALAELWIDRQAPTTGTVPGTTPSGSAPEGTNPG